MKEPKAVINEVTLTRVFDAPIDLVYRAWTDAEHVTKWMKCDVEATLEVENWVPEVGAEFKTHMAQPGVFETWGTGRFTEVDPPNLLEYASDPDPKLGVGEMRVRVELEDFGGRTQVTLTHFGMPDEICGIIEGGWTASLAQLEPVVEALLNH